MALKEPHGVVVVRFSSGTVHRAETGQGHGESALETGDWELFPNVVAAREAGYQLCQSCYNVPQPRWVMGGRDDRAA